MEIYLYDYKGSTTAIVNENGDILNAYIYSAYGKVLGSRESVENSYKYLGQYGVITDSDNLIYVRARYYSPDLGRWTQLDAKRGAITNPLSLNRYALNEGDGVNYIDINGFDRVSNNLSRKECIQKKRRDCLFKVSDNNKADGSEPLYELSMFSSVKDNISYINEAGKKYGIEPNLIKSIIYMETTHGYYDKLFLFSISIKVFYLWISI